MYITIPNTAKHARYRGSARGESHTSVARITGASRQQCHRVGRRRLKFRAVPHTHRQRRIGALRTAPPRATAPAASAIGGLVKSPARARWVQQRRVGAHCRQRAAWRARSCQRRQPRRERVRRRARQVWRRAQHVRRVQRAACQPVQRHHSRRTRCGVVLGPRLGVRLLDSYGPESRNDSNLTLTLNHSLRLDSPRPRERDFDSDSHSPLPREVNRIQIQIHSVQTPKSRDSESDSEFLSHEMTP